MQSFMSKDYRVDFWKLDKTKNEKTHLGFLYLDDQGVTAENTLHAKAFRLCSDKQLYANLLTTTEV